MYCQHNINTFELWAHCRDHTTIAIGPYQEITVSEHSLANREGQRVPEVSFRIRRKGEWATVTSDDIFSGKNVVVFSLPGAFTPTCSSTHLPRFNELAPAFKAQGIDAIVCVSVNDPFVMEEWGRDQEAQNVFLLPDGNGKFTEQMGLLVDKSDLNFGKRSWRYSMLVRDRVIEKMFIEPDEAGDPFKVSDADTMLAYLNPNARKPDQVAILTRDGCSFCARAKHLLDDAGYDFAEVPLRHTIRTKALGAIASAATVPQVFINGRLIGGLEDLTVFLKKAA
jgi:glutathione-dependent peroxiredoxin